MDKKVILSFNREVKNWMIVQVSFAGEDKTSEMDTWTLLVKEDQVHPLVSQTRGVEGYPVWNGEEMKRV